ncbi:GmrSD restriction endonuclease domain-containing protein [Paraburkholderia guartelaensis]|uniref:GmrSD restriction endonuclease domain-containing protein n=1 Tax=Paraburkholderia guartelaensis TaxID=2546446 RepID=UPI002AB5E87C|nr:DUF262 domain-containing protein [Paraburkholderia guartelaensis]
MQQLSPTERKMWREVPTEFRQESSAEEINQKYAKRELRIVTETNREQLPNFVQAMQRDGWLKLQPFYQRRQRWDDKRKSKLIESFIMNIPVPPCFLYESDFARYEVMDGQQRISAVADFYENRFKLKGLEQWPELNGLIYDRLPSEVRRGLDRRSISYIVLLKESANTRDEELLLRQQVFERLNTGGVELENQEVRHCIYHNEFDDLLIELSRHPAMRDAWGLVRYEKEEDRNPPQKLLSNPHFSKMRDVEFVLRCLALRHVERYRGGMQRFLDEYMVRSRHFGSDDIHFLRHLFGETIELAQQIFGDILFRPWNVKADDWAPKPHIAYADALMVALSERLEDKVVLANARAHIVAGAKRLVEEEPVGTFTGQGNTREAVESRIAAFRRLLTTIVEGN